MAQRLTDADDVVVGVVGVVGRRRARVWGGVGRAPSSRS